MGNLETGFINIKKKIRQLAFAKMQQKMDRAAKKIISSANRMRDFDDVTGNLYKSIAIGTYYKGELQNIYHTPGGKPTRLTLAKGETYNLPYYYGSGIPVDDSWIKPFTGQYGEGGESGERAAEDALLSSEGEFRKGRDLVWQLKLVAGVDYAQFVETQRKHDVISSLRDYTIRYYHNM